MIPKKRPLYVFHTESIYLRGGEKYLYEILRRVAKDRPVVLYLHAVSPWWRSRYTHAGVSVFSLWRPRRLYWLCIPLTILIDYISVRQAIKRDDVIFATNFPMNFLAVSLSHNTICHCAEPLPIFYDRVRINSLPLFSQLCVFLAKLAYAPWDSWSYQRCSLLTTLNPSVEKHVLNVHKRKPDIFLTNGVDDQRFYPAIKSTPRKRFVIGHSTDYTVFKGTQDFLAAINVLHKSGVNFQAFISESIRDPKMKRVYLSYIKEHNLQKNISFVGTLSEHNLAKFYKNLDVFVFTGSPEGSGAAAASLSVLEAQACGVPVVRSIGEDFEIVEGKTGYHTDPHDGKATAFAIRKILSKSYTQKKKMGDEARKHVTKFFSWNTTTNVLNKTIKGLSDK